MKQGKRRIIITGAINAIAYSVLSDAFEIVNRVEEMRLSDPKLFKGFSEPQQKVSRGKGKKYKQWDKR